MDLMALVVLMLLILYDRRSLLINVLVDAQVANCCNALLA